MSAATMYFMVRRTPYTSSRAATIYIITCIITRRQGTMENVVGGKMAGLYVCACVGWCKCVDGGACSPQTYCASKWLCECARSSTWCLRPHKQHGCGATSTAGARAQRPRARARGHARPTLALAAPPLPTLNEWRSHSNTDPSAQLQAPTPTPPRGYVFFPTPILSVVAIQRFEPATRRRDDASQYVAEAVPLLGAVAMWPRLAWVSLAVVVVWLGVALVGQGMVVV